MSFLIEDGRVSFAGTELNQANAETFEALGGSFGRDARGAWSGVVHLEGVTAPDRIRVIDEQYATDGVLVYAGSKVLGEADPTSFVSCSACFAKDRHQVWAYGDPIDGVDAESFEALTEEVGRDRNRAYVVSTPNPADGSSLRHLGACYFADADRVYFRFYDELGVVQNTDLGTFEILAGYYARDKNGVFNNGFLIENADPRTIRVLDQDCCCDHRAVYYSVTEIAGADPSSFETLALYLSKDKDHVFVHGAVELRLDAASCCVVNSEGLDYGHVVDATAAYFFGFGKFRKFRCDLSTLEILDSEFAKDARHVYRRGRKIQDADPATFELLEPYYSRDAERVYTHASWHRETPIVEGADAASLIAMGSEFGTDRNNLYYLGEPAEESKTNGDRRVVSFIEGRPDLAGYWWNRR